jgi:hypothetical protein
MKKTLTSLLLASALGTAAVAAPFNGWYAGVETGYASRSNEYSATDIVINNASAANAKSTKKTNGMLYNFFAGYGVTSNNFYFGGEVHFGDSNNSKSNAFDFSNSAGKQNVTAKYDRGMNYGIAPRFGYAVTPDMLVFFKLGLEMSRDKTSVYSAQDNATFTSRSKTKTVLVPGLGLEKAWGNVIGRVAVEYNMGAKVGQAIDQAGAYKLNGSAKYSEWRLKLGAAWAF